MAEKKKGKTIKVGNQSDIDAVLDAVKKLSAFGLVLLGKEIYKLLIDRGIISRKELDFNINFLDAMFGAGIKDRIKPSEKEMIDDIMRHLVKLSKAGLKEVFKRLQILNILK